MSLLRKRPTFRYTPPVPGSPALAAGVQCPPPGAGFTYVLRNGSYVRTAQANPFTPARNLPTLPGLCVQPYTSAESGGTVLGPCLRSG